MQKLKKQTDFLFCERVKNTEQGLDAFDIQGAVIKELTGMPSLLHALTPAPGAVCIRLGQRFGILPQRRSPKVCRQAGGLSQDAITKQSVFLLDK